MKNTSYNKYKSLISKKKITTYRICKDTGIPETVMSNWKNRGGNLSAENLYKVAKRLEVPMEYFME